MKAKWIVAACLSFAPAICAADAARAQPIAKDEGSQVVCHREQVTGSHLPKKVCMTKAERERRRKADQQAMQRIQSRPGR